MKREIFSNEQMVFGYLIAAENLMRLRRVIVFEHWEHFLSPSAASLEPLISCDESERCSVQKSGRSLTECLRSGWPLGYLGALVG